MALQGFNVFKEDGHWLLQLQRPNRLPVEGGRGPMGAGGRWGLSRGSGITKRLARALLLALAMAAASTLVVLATRLLRPAQSCSFRHRPFHLSAVR